MFYQKQKDKRCFKLKITVDKTKHRCYNKDINKKTKCEEKENRTMIKTNVEIAKMVEERGYDFQTALDSIDFGRTAEEEEMEITQEEINELVDAVCSSFEQERN